MSSSLFPDFTNVESHIFIYFVTTFYYITMSFQWSRENFVTYVCYLNYISMSYADFSNSYYSQFTGKISLRYSVIGYITSLCITSK